MTTTLAEPQQQNLNQCPYRTNCWVKNCKIDECSRCSIYHCSEEVRGTPDEKISFGMMEVLSKAPQKQRSFILELFLGL